MEKKRKKVDVKVFLTRCLMCGLILYICGFFVSQQFDLARLSKEDKQLTQQIAEAERIHQELAKEKEAAGTPESIERVAREDLGLMKPGEKVFITSKTQ